ncbi:Triheme cytochrome c [Candidatus Nitromaritima sp. SCGC AAA799-C22]|nr:Triheme cytochrome c [Candidatus Nitromaritima sp. SCGC AAA799-C22]
MASTKAKLLSPPWLLIAVIGFVLTLGGRSSPVYAFDSPGASDMPATLQVDGRQVSLKELKNPFPAGSDQAVQEGAEIYIKNCVLCHGDLLDGKGLFGESFFPRPANFLQEPSVLNKPPAYAYWRIMKGGPGLPEKFAPWNSAMPAWEGALSEDEVWKVILYIDTTVKERLQSPPPSPKPSAEQGKKIYADKCAICHGNEGKGDGPFAAISSPHPRNFTKGHIKLRTTPFGKIPTDRDLFNVITRGMRGTTMPGWKHLPENDRHSLVFYLKTLSKKFAKFVKKGKSHKVVKVSEPPAFTLDSLARGKELFVQNCSACHGIKGRSDGASTKKIVNIPTDAIWPRNLTKPWNFRRGNKRKQLFLTLRTGLSGTAMPRFSPRIFKDEQIWDIVHYVQTLALSQKPAVPKVLRVEKTEGPLPTDPDDPLWNTIDDHFYPLGGQVIQSKKAYHPITDNVVVKAVHNGNEIAFRIHWDDPTADPVLKKWIIVEESPPPPLPAHLQTDEPEEEPENEPQPQDLPDSIAIQFPVSLDTGKPHFLNGDKAHPVNLWKWSSYPMNAVEMNAAGMEHLTKQETDSQSLLSKAVFRYGRYSLVIRRQLTTPDTQNDIQFQPGQTLPIAFNVWNGTEGETGSMKAVSSWFDLILE